MGTAFMFLVLFMGLGLGWTFGICYCINSDMKRQKEREDARIAAYEAARANDV